MSSKDTFRERFLESNDRFQAAMLDALKAHQAGVIVVMESLQKLDELQASVDELKENDAELKRLILEQGTEIRALRARLDEH